MEWEKVKDDRRTAEGERMVGNEKTRAGRVCVNTCKTVGCFSLTNTHTTAQQVKGLVTQADGSVFSGLILVFS